jgi:hypothetical protein
MPTYRRIAVFAIIVPMIFVRAASAWDDVGHKITGYIAWQRMSPAAREKVVEILRKAPEDSHLSAFYMPFGPQAIDAKRLNYFTLVPTWADIVRDQEFKNRHAKYHRSNWHYSDTFWRQVDGRIEVITDRQPGGQGVNKLVEFDRVMRGGGGDVADADKAIAIAWFLHIGGDLHQPLHTSGRHTDREPEGDQGGNLFLLSPEDGPRESRLNLHWFWDSIVSRNMPFIREVSEGEYIKLIAESMMLKHPYAEAEPNLKLAAYADWQKESFALANTDVFSANLKRFEMPSAAYRRNAYRVAEQRLAMAGYRMGETLDRIFGAASAGSEN